MPKGDRKKKIAEFDGIDIRVLTRNEHCGPHVHAFHEGDGWELRIFFSFASDQIFDITLEAGDLPKRKVVQKCMDAVVTNLDECRRQFWEGVGKHCLDHQYVLVDGNGFLRHAEKDAPGALRVKTAKYIAGRKSVEFVAYGHTKKFAGICP